MTRQDVLDLNWHNVEADTCVVLHVKHTCELIFQPSTVVKCIYTDVLTILFFSTNNKEGIGRSKAAAMCCCWFVVDCCSHCGVLCLFHVLLYIAMCPFLFCNHLDGEERAGCFTLVVFLVSCSSSLRCRGLVCSVWLWYFLIILTFSYSSILLRFSKRVGYGLSCNS